MIDSNCEKLIPVVIYKVKYDLIENIYKIYKIDHVQFVSTSSNGRNFLKNAFDIVAVFGNKVELNVASTLLLVWTEFNVHPYSR